MLVVLISSVGCGQSQRQREADSTRVVRDSTDRQREIRIAEIGSRFNASRKWVGELDSLNRILETPFTIVLQDAFSRDTTPRHLLLGYVADVWRDSIGVAVGVLDRDLEDVVFDLRCPPAQDSVRPRTRNSALGDRFGATYVVVAESLRVERNGRPPTTLSLRTGGGESTEGNIEGIPVIHGRCVTISKISE